MTNHTTITGNLAAAPELRFTQSGKAVLSARVADTPRRYDQQSGQWEDAGETLWVDVSLWGPDAEAISEQIGQQKGRVTVTGRLGIRSYTSKSGEERRQVTLNAESFHLHAPKNRQQQPSGGWGQAPAQGDPWGGGGNDQAPPF